MAGRLALGMVIGALALSATRADDLPRALGWLGAGVAPVPGPGTCSAVLVAPDLVATAAHCLADPRTGVVRDLAGLRFIAGWGGPAVAPPVAGKAAIFPAARLLASGSLPYDMALLRLAGPVEGVAPLPFDPTPEAPDTPVTLGGYAQADPARPIRRDPCRKVLVALPVLGLDCRAEGGFSGGAMLTMGPDGWRLVAVTVAEARNDPGLGALGVTPPDDLAAVIAGK